MRDLFRKFKTLFFRYGRERRHYDSIGNLPIGLWKRINETGELKFLVISGDYTNEELREAWLNIYQEYIDEFGASEEYIDLMKLRKEEGLLRIRLELTGDRFLKTKLEIVKSKMSQLMSGKNVKFERIIAIVDKFMSFPIDEELITVRRFYNYLQMLKNGRRAQRN